MLIFKSKALILFFLKFRNFQGFQGPVGTQNIIQSVILNANRHVILCDHWEWTALTTLRMCVSQSQSVSQVVMGFTVVTGMYTDKRFPS